MTRTVTVGLPEGIYARLKRSAEATSRSVEELVVQSVKAGMPPSVSDFAPEYGEECLALERLSSSRLRQIARAKLPEGRQRRYNHLLTKNQAGALSEREQEMLKHFGDEARRLTVRRAYAYALLRWRGQPIPTPHELTHP
jgi:hypothetical protein